MVLARGHIPPAASIVIATYNRPQVLDYAISSVLQSTVNDWELIAVGDGCTDDTEALVRSFGDPRISWHNLPENSGNQAAPNNAGVERARGRYLFFLNHDDMWFAGGPAGCARRAVRLICAGWGPQDHGSSWGAAV